MNICRFVADERWLDLVGRNIPFIIINKKDDYAYFKAIDEMMEKSEDGLIIVEQDILVDDQTVDSFMRKAEGKDVVVYPYKIYPVTTGWDHPVYAHRIVTQGDRSKCDIISARWIEKGEPYCDLYGFGFVYIKRRLWDLIAPRINKHWRTLDANFSIRTWCLGIKAEVLWDYEPEHLHR
jgi:hypothetical protein